MTNEKESFLLNVKLETLKTIRGVNFTAREMEILACIISVRRIKKIASLLSIAPKTAETHVRNIMLKIQCNSRESIVDFIEQSGKLSLIKHHYQHLVHQKTPRESFSEEDFLQSSPSVLGQSETTDNSDSESALKPHVLENSQTMAFFSLTPINNLTRWARSFSEFKNKIRKPFKKHTYSMILGIVFLMTVAALVYWLTPFSNATKTLSSHRPKSAQDFQSGSNKSVPPTPPKYISIVRSPLSPPQDTSLLDREELIQEMTEKLNKQIDIQTIALVGIGGAGKTTLTRQYERSQNASVTWEINAETKYSLSSSFKDLAYALAQTAEQRDELTFIQNIQNQEERDKLILSFVRKTLKENPGWLLIYDNVTTFSDIRSHFPTESALWGAGQVIITTQDLNIKNSLSAENILSIDELTQEKQFTLFVKIFHNCESDQLSQIQKDQILAFLKNIPPFPLDISVAAQLHEQSQPVLRSIFGSHLSTQSGL